VTRETLKELKIGDISQIIVYNKADKCQMDLLPRVSENSIHMAAGAGIGIRELTELIQKKLYEGQQERAFLIPYEQGGIASRLMEQAVVLEQEYREDGIYLKVHCDNQDTARYEKYLVEDM